MDLKRMTVLTSLLLAAVLLWGFQANADVLVFSDPPEIGDCTQCHSFGYSTKIVSGSLDGPNTAQFLKNGYNDIMLRNLMRGSRDPETIFAEQPTPSPVATTNSTSMPGSAVPLAMATSADR